MPRNSSNSSSSSWIWVVLKQRINDWGSAGAVISVPSFHPRR